MKQVDNPGVRVPPPLVYLTAVLVGAAIDRFAPIRVLPASFASPLGGALVVLGVITLVLSGRALRRAGTTIHPDRPVAALVTTGPFRYSRNPIYLAMSVVQVGVGVWLNNVWVLVLLVPALAWIARRAVAPEERYLERTFGQRYLDYRASVRRWL